MQTSLIAITAPRCTRCNVRLAYEGRPCHVCLSPATYSMRDGAMRGAKGRTRRDNPRLPKFALPPAIRGKQARLPRHERVIKTFRVIGRWTWNSLAIAAALHLGLLAIALFLHKEIEQLVIQVQKVELRDRIAAPPAPEPTSVDMPSPDPVDEELITPDIVNDEPIDTGDPEIDTPPEERDFAPAPAFEPPRANLEMPFPERLPNAGQGLGGGRPDTARNPPTPAGLLGNRKGERKEAAVRKFGGGEETEGAVNLGLEYLAKQQSSDGSWDPNRGFEDPPAWARHGNGYRGKVTALCVLPFLAAGHSPEEGRYRRTVRTAIRWLMRKQASDGCISHPETGDMYMHSVATLALCEAYGLTSDRDTGRAAERAVRFLERSQGAGGGWDYNGFITVSDVNGGERNDGSISGWGVLALKSAKSVGITVNERTWSKMVQLYDRLSLDTGETYYADQAYGRLPGTRRGIGMTGVGLASRVILDDVRFGRRNAAAERLLLDDAPAWKSLLQPTISSENPNFHTFYGWYYGTLGMFLKNQGEGHAWNQWNDALKKALLPMQVTHGSRRGSWPAADSWIGPIMGDLYSTACCVLCLEVYYRYNPANRIEVGVPAVKLDEPPPKAEPASTPEPGSSSVRSSALRDLARAKGLDATAELIKALQDEAIIVRTTALVELARIGAKDAAPTVAEMLTLPENDPLRVTIADTLGRLGDRSVYPSLIRLLSDSEVYMQESARAALKRLAGGKDFGINKHAWRDWFERNP